MCPGGKALSTASFPQTHRKNATQAVPMSIVSLGSQLISSISLSLCESRPGVAESNRNGRGAEEGSKRQPTYQSTMTGALDTQNGFAHGQTTFSGPSMPPAPLLSSSCGVLRPGYREDGMTHASEATHVQAHVHAAGPCPPGGMRAFQRQGVT